MSYRNTTDLSVCAAMEPLVSPQVVETLSKESRLFRVVVLGIYRATVGPEWTSRGQLQSDYNQHIHLPRAGSAKIRFNNQPFVLEVGQLYWLPGNCPVERVTAKNYLHDIIQFRFESLIGKDLLLDWVGRAPRVLGPGNCSELERVLDSGRLNLASFMQIESMILESLLCTVPDLPEIFRFQSRIFAKYQPIFDHIRDHLSADLRIEDFARNHGKSLNAFSMAFRRDLGISPKTYLNRQLNEKACRLLLEVPDKLKVISERLRFADEFHFSRFFLRMNGLRPSHYRRIWRKSDTGE